MKFGIDKCAVLELERGRIVRSERIESLNRGEEQCTRVVRKVDNKWVFEERDRGHVICSSGVGTKNQCNQSKDRQTTSFSKM